MGTSVHFLNMCSIISIRDCFRLLESKTYVSAAVLQSARQQLQRYAMNNYLSSEQKSRYLALSCGSVEHEFHSAEAFPQFGLNHARALSSAPDYGKLKCEDAEIQIIHLNLSTQRIIEYIQTTAIHRVVLAYRFICQKLHMLHSYRLVQLRNHTIENYEYVSCFYNPEILNAEMEHHMQIIREYQMLVRIQRAFERMRQQNVYDHDILIELKYQFENDDKIMEQYHLLCNLMITHDDKIRQNTWSKQILSIIRKRIQGWRKMHDNDLICYYGFHVNISRDVSLMCIHHYFAMNYDESIDHYLDFKPYHLSDDDLLHADLSTFHEWLQIYEKSYDTNKLIKKEWDHHHLRFFIHANVNVQTITFT